MFVYRILLHSFHVKRKRGKNIADTSFSPFFPVGPEATKASKTQKITTAEEI